MRKTHQPRAPHPSEHGRCACGKMRMQSRKEAKAAIRRMVGQGAGSGHMNAYRCHVEPDWWHVGHQPAIITRGEISRAEFDPGLRTSGWWER